MKTRNMIKQTLKIFSPNLDIYLRAHKARNSFKISCQLKKNGFSKNTLLFSIKCTPSCFYHSTLQINTFMMKIANSRKKLRVSH